MPENKISQEQVKRIAKLNKISLTNDEILKLSKFLSETLKYVDVLDELATDEVLETYQVTGLTNIYIEENDEITTLTKKEALYNAFQTIDGMFATKAVFTSSEEKNESEDLDETE